MRTLIVTAGDEGFMPLLRGLVLSLQQAQASFTDLAVLDVGLEAASRDWLTRYSQHIREPGWDLPVAPSLRQEKPHQRALTARPFLRDYFPGYDVYLWMDADTWVQEAYALEWFVKAASTGAMGIVPENDRAYRHDRGVLAWRQRGVEAFFGPDAVEYGQWDRYANCGVVALRDTAPHWELWARYFREGLDHAEGKTCSDQAALNHMLWREQPEVHPLPALCNWLCHLCVPAYKPAPGKFCEPFVPWHTIGILHLAGSSKSLVLKMQPQKGVESDLTLRFPGS